MMGGREAGERKDVALQTGQLMVIERPGLPDLELTFTGCRQSRGRMLAYDTEGVRYFLRSTGERNRFRLTSN
jgi:hypothetical protein